MLIKQEIGSEFWDIPSISDGDGFNLLHDCSCWLRCGRDALRFILEDIAKERTLSTIALPSYCCESLITPAISMGLSVFFYPVEISDKGGLSFCFDTVRDCDAILVMDYFGYASDWSTSSLDSTLIMDVTHSAFMPCSHRFDYAFGSLRKWAGFWGGGFAIKASGSFSIDQPSYCDEVYFSKRQRAMELKWKYLKEGIGEKEVFLALFAEAEEILDSGVVSAGHPRDKKLMASLDCDFIVNRRRENAQCLLHYVSRNALFPYLKESDVPLFVPLLLAKQNRDGLRDYLVSKNVFCPIHWPKTELHTAHGADSVLYDQEISLICDQRYGISDMKRIGQLVSDYLEIAG